ncbi:MAG: lipoyl domain-containing protein [Betaproteobacteria bacterium]|nr:lipoyl domain-containing protein [Betaproteobacteria bacterium]MDE2357863.1 lipoyl domain-containing protein [Betaproteobacteria bacterium]
MIELKLGRIGMNMEEATIKAWHKAAGDSFRQGEPLYDIETEKVATEIAAPFDGKLLEIVANVDDSVDVGGVVCRVEPVASPA